MSLMPFPGRSSWKNGDKTSSNNGPKKHRRLLLCLEFMTHCAKRGQICCRSKSTDIHKQFGMATHTSPHSLTFFYVCLTWHHPPPSTSSPKPTQLIAVGESSTSQCHTLSTPPLSLYCHFELSAAMDWQG